MPENLFLISLLLGPAWLLVGLFAGAFLMHKASVRQSPVPFVGAVRGMIDVISGKWRKKASPLAKPVVMKRMKA